MELNLKTLREAAMNVYCAWQGGTMEDVRNAMSNLGNVLSQLKLNEQLNACIDCPFDGQDNVYCRTCPFD